MDINELLAQLEILVNEEEEDGFYSIVDDEYDVLTAHFAGDVPLGYLNGDDGTFDEWLWDELS